MKASNISGSFLFTHLFEASIHNPDFLSRELGLSKEFLEGDRPGVLLPGPRTLEVEKRIFRSRRVRRRSHSWSAFLPKGREILLDDENSRPVRFLLVSFTVALRLIRPSPLFSSSLFSFGSPPTSSVSSLFRFLQRDREERFASNCKQITKVIQVSSTWRWTGNGVRLREGKLFIRNGKIEFLNFRDTLW